MLRLYFLKRCRTSIAQQQSVQIHLVVRFLLNLAHEAPTQLQVNAILTGS